MRKTKSLSQLDLESARMGYMDEVRRDARRQMAVVAIVLTCQLADAKYLVSIFALLEI